MKEHLEEIILETFLKVLMINGIENQYLSNNIDQNYYCSDYCNINVHKCGVKCGTSLRFWENKGWMNSMDPYGWFHGILDIS